MFHVISSVTDVFRSNLAFCSTSSYMRNEWVSCDITPHRMLFEMAMPWPWLIERQVYILLLSTNCRQERWRRCSFSEVSRLELAGIATGSYGEFVPLVRENYHSCHCHNVGQEVRGHCVCNDRARALRLEAAGTVAKSGSSLVSSRDDEG